MQIIGASTPTANPSGEFTEGSPVGGVPATLITAAWLNSIQRELVSLVLGAGIQLSAADDAQVFKAIKLMIKDLLPSSGGTLSGSIVLSNNGEDSPEFGWRTPSCTANMDVLDSRIRVSATHNGVFSTALVLDVPQQSASVFGNALWHGGNFKPSDKLDVTATAASANKLSAARTISLGGAITGSGSFDGSSGITINVALADIGVIPGTYSKLTINGKGQVVGSGMLAQTDIPNLDWSKITSGKPGTLAGYGISDGLSVSAKATPAEIEAASPINKYVDPAGVFAATQDVLCGAVFFYAASSPPPGSLKANGAAVSRTIYWKLFARIGTFYGAGDGVTTFNLPDVRGEFGRFWDDARGVDYGRAFGSWQAQALEAHSHPLSASANFTYQLNTDTNMKPYQGAGASYQTGLTGGSETRPRNVALLGCIKY